MQTHSETYNINGRLITAKADFMQNELSLSCNDSNYSEQFPLSEYTEFEGDMRAFAESQLFYNGEYVFS